MSRYIVDIRTGCAAVRDTHHIDYNKEGNGLHSDFGSVVEYIAYHNNHKGDGGDFEEQDERIKVKFLEDICSLLNFKHQTETPEEKEAFDSMAQSDINNIHKPHWAKWSIGDEVTKVKGSSWTGKVVGYYSTSLTSKGYAVESLTEKGSVQIYPEAALSDIETPQQREEREREENGEALWSLFGYHNPKTPTWGSLKPDYAEKWRELAEKLNYRKAK